MKKVDGGEAVQKERKKEDLDGEVENVDGVVVLTNELKQKQAPIKKKILRKVFALGIMELQL